MRNIYTNVNVLVIATGEEFEACFVNYLTKRDLYELSRSFRKIAEAASLSDIGRESDGWREMIAILKRNNGLACETCDPNRRGALIMHEDSLCYVPVDDFVMCDEIAAYTRNKYRDEIKESFLEKLD